MTILTLQKTHIPQNKRNSAEEVSETERYQKPSKQPREDEYPHSHREIPVRMTKGKRGKSSDLEQSKYKIQSKPKGKQKKAVDQSDSKASQHEMANDAHGKCESVARKHKQR